MVHAPDAITTQLIELLQEIELLTFSLAMASVIVDTRRHDPAKHRLPSFMRASVTVPQCRGGASWSAWGLE